jgi:hypothetical protein
VSSAAKTTTMDEATSAVHPVMSVRLAVALALAAVICMALATPALARQAWRVDAFSNTTVAPGETIDHFVQAVNVGDASMDGSTITWTARFPAPVTVVTADILDLSSLAITRCFDARDGTSPVAGASSIICRNTASLPRSQAQRLRLTTTTGAGATLGTTLMPEFEVSGGGATTVTAVDPILVAASPPGFGIEAFDGEVLDAAGAPETQAGAHPDSAAVSIDFNTLRNPDALLGSLWPAGPLRNVFVDLPPGFVGNPTVPDRCTLAQLANMSGQFLPLPLCAATSQVGTTLVRLRTSRVGKLALGPLPVFSLVPPADVPARFGFNILGTIVTLDAELRSGGDYGLSVNTKNIPQALGIAGTDFTFWGVPASPAHDLERACPGETPPWEGGRSCPSGAPLRPFLRNPTACTEPGVGLATTARIEAWDNPGVLRSATWVTHLPPGYPLPSDQWGDEVGVTGCSRVPFNPTFTARPATTTQAGKPAGFTFDLTLPQSDEIDAPGTADLKQAVVTLPLGVRVSPSSADGLGACSPAQIGIRDGNVPTCPESSKIGAVTIDTPLLERPLSGAVYLARQRDNPFGSLLSIYIVAQGPGLVVKLPGLVTAHPISGQLTATFDDNPQLPFSNLHVEFKSGPRAPLVLPKQCGPYTTNAVLTSWSGKTVESNSSFTVDQGCGRTFTPDFQAGTQNPVAGRSSTFSLRLSRDDEDQELAGLSLDLPRGLTGRIASVPLCSDADANANACSESSRVGSVTVGAGAGTNPFYISSGRVYLTGPYKGAPFGLSVVVPAVAGPFDLGVVTVRQALFVDKHTAEVRVVSDPLPTILEGIPLDVRDVRVTVDRDGFFLNPTSCQEKTITGTILSTEGATADVSSRFQVGDCGNLTLRPRMTLTVGGNGRTGRNSTTPLVATLRQTPGQSNLASVRVTLPATINARLTVINRACTQAEFEAGNCRKAIAGTAVANTPLLRDPLRGNAYFVKDPSRPRGALPNLVVALRGQVDFDLIGKISIPRDKFLATTFDAIPDVPITSFTLRLVPGRRGSLGTTVNLCSSRGRAGLARIEFDAQNGRELDVSQRLRIKGCGSPRGRGAKAKRR